MAGAERVEGTLFGNGERTGNVDLVTLGIGGNDLDLFTTLIGTCTQLRAEDPGPLQEGVEQPTRLGAGRDRLPVRQPAVSLQRETERLWRL